MSRDQSTIVMMRRSVDTAVREVRSIDVNDLSEAFDSAEIWELEDAVGKALSALEKLREVLKGVGA